MGNLNQKTQKLVSKPHTPNPIEATPVPDVAILDLPSDHRLFGTFIKGLAQEETIGFGCDGCEREMRLDELRYHCWFCGNFDLCQECFSQVNHKHTMSLEDADNGTKTSRVHASSSSEMFERVLSEFRGRPFLGYRPLPRDTVHVEPDEVFHWITYDQTREWVESIRKSISVLHRHVMEIDTQYDLRKLCSFISVFFFSLSFFSFFFLQKHI